MKTVFDKEIGGDGAKVSVTVDEQSLNVNVSYPTSKIIEPATKAVGGLLDKLKAAIPGSWDDALIDKLKGEFEADLLKLIGN